MAMTIEQVRNWHVKCATLYASSGESALADQHQRMADAITAHITQTAQAVDVGAIREVIGWLQTRDGLRVNIGGLADKLTRALAGSPPAWCPKCATNQPHHADPNSGGCLHLCDVCNSIVEY